MSLSTCLKCGGNIPLGPGASNRCDTCGEHVFGNTNMWGAKNASEPCCPWKKDEEGIWFSCSPEEGGRNAFTFDTGDPEDNGFKFCPRCGKKIVVIDPCAE